MNDKWINKSGIFYPIPGDVVIHSTPGNGVWEVVENPNPQIKELGLKRVADKFEFPFKLYETGGSEINQKVYDLWTNEKYIESNKNLGVIFNGIKGTGKTLSAKLLCNKLDIPVLIVNNTFDGLILDFITRLSFEAAILIDEAEKTFSGKEEKDSHILLKLIDGVYNKSRKLYILTTNNLYLDDNLMGRPGRIRYIQEFGNLHKETVLEYLNDTLEDKSKIEEVMNVVDTLEISTIDILKSVVEEFNIFGTIGGERTPMNLPKSSYIFDAICFQNYTEDDVDELKQTIEEMRAGKSLSEWYLEVPEDEDDEEDEKEELCVDKPVISAKGECLRKISAVPKISLKRFEKGDKYAFKTKITSKFPNLFQGCDTNCGVVLNEIKDGTGFVFLKTRWDGIRLYLIVSQTRGLSVYKKWKV